MSLANTNEILNEMKARLAGVNWVGPSGSQPAFQKIELYDSTNLAEAFQELLISQQRVALVVWTGEHWDTERSGIKITSKRTLTVSVIVSDRVMGRKREAVYGNAATPGAVALKDLSVPALTGRLKLNPGGVECAPVNSDFLVLEDLKSNQPGRVACVVDFELAGGTIEVPTGPGPVR